MLYVKVSGDNTVFYVEGVYGKYGNEDLLINKQMIKSGFDSIPSLYYDVITKNQSETEFLADLDEIRKAYVQDDSRSHSDNQNIPQNFDNGQEEKTHLSRDLFADYDQPITRADVDALHSRFTSRTSVNHFSQDDLEATAKWAYKYYQQMGVKSPFFRAW